MINGPARNAEAGRQLALYTAVESEGEANVLWVTTSYPIVVPTLDGADGEGGFKPTLEGLCDCPIESLDVPPEAIGVDSPARIVSALQANPDINYVVSPLGDLFVGLPGALKDVGIADRVTLVTHDQNPTLSAAVEDGTISAVVGFPGSEEMFQAMDTFLRFFTDVEFSPNSDDFPSLIDSGVPSWLTIPRDHPSASAASFSGLPSSTQAGTGHWVHMIVLSAGMSPSNGVVLVISVGRSISVATSSRCWHRCPASE